MVNWIIQPIILGHKEHVNREDRFMKKYVMFIMILLLCGCAPKYQLTIDGTNIEEDVFFTIDNSKIVQEEIGPELSLYNADTIDYLKNGNLNAILDNQESIYEKQVTEEGQFTSIHLKYAYQPGEISQSRILNECFENKEITVNKKKITIHLSGHYYCFDEEGGEAEFKVLSKNKVTFANTDYGIFDNEYTWTINDSNKDNVDIHIELSTRSKWLDFAILIIGGIVGIALVVGILVIVQKVSNRDKINEI